MDFDNLFLISVYARDEPITSLSEFSYYLSLLTNPEFFIDIPKKASEPKALFFFGSSFSVENISRRECVLR